MANEVWMPILLDERNAAYEPVDEGHETLTKNGWVIGWAEIDGRWRIAAKKVVRQPGLSELLDDGDPMPFGDAPRPVLFDLARILAALERVIGQLVES